MDDSPNNSAESDDLKVRMGKAMAIYAEARGQTGDRGELPCTKCGSGVVHWARVGRRRHMRMKCTTPSCLELLE